MLDALAQTPADLLLLDVGMPGLDGHETGRLLRGGAVQPDLPVIFVSGRVDIEDRRLGYAAGGNDYLAKPYDIDEPQGKIKLATEHHRRVRLMATRQDALVRSATGDASALERDLIEHLATMRDARILTLTGQNLGFSFGSVTLLVRCLAWAAAPDTPETADAMARARDNVAMMFPATVQGDRQSEVASTMA